MTGHYNNHPSNNNNNNTTSHPSSSNSNHHSSSSTSNSFQKGLARWTKRMSGTIASCGGTIHSLPSEDHSFDNNNNNSNNSNNNNKGVTTSNSLLEASESTDSHSSVTEMHQNKPHSSYSHKPPRKTQQHNNKKLVHPHSHRSHKSTGDHSYDHHTLGTATTATISYASSTNEDDLGAATNDNASIASEVGMEVVMTTNHPANHNSNNSHSSSSNNHNHNHVTTTTSWNTHTQVAATHQGDAHYKSHSFPAGKHTFTVDRRYNMLRVIGSGAYGVVISATDSNHNNSKEDGGAANSADSEFKVAIKMVPKAFSDEIDAKRILREIKLLKHFHHDNIVSIMDMMPPNVAYLQDFHDVYMVTDLMETDLHRIIYSKQKLSADHVQYFIYQVLRGLKYIHSCKVLHRDLKPSNLLVNSNCDLKICDFGLARGIDRGDATTDENKESTMLLTEYVVTRWYRAPEIMLACHEYSYPIDVWSVGCILAELLLRKPMFPGEDYIDQLTIISEKLGKLPESDLDFVTSEKARRFMRKLPNKAPSHLSLLFPGTPLDALDAMRRMLEIHPGKRCTVQQALEHDFFEPLHNESDEPVSSRPFDFSFEKLPPGQKLHRLKLQELIWSEVADFRPSCLPVAPPRKTDQNP